MKLLNDESLKIRVERMIEQLVALVPNRQEAEILAAQLRAEFYKSHETKSNKANQLSCQDDISELRKMTHSHQ